MIHLSKASKIYKMGKIDVSALSGVSLYIKQGEMISIVGPSGSGKSTLMNIIGCLDVLTSGDYFFGDQDISKLSDNSLAEIRNQKIGFIFQTYNLLPKLTAQSNVELSLLYGQHSNKKKKAVEALEKVGLGSRINHKPTELSGGEQQRVGIARALAKNPSIILADEPTGNLDSQSSGEIMDILRRLHNQDGLTIVVVTHEMAIAQQTQRIIHMMDGKIAEDKVNTSRVKPLPKIEASQ